MQIDMMLAHYISKFSSLSNLFCHPITHQPIRDPEIGYELFKCLSSGRLLLHWVSSCEKGLVREYLSMFVAIEGFVLTIHGVGIDCPQIRGLVNIRSAQYRLVSSRIADHSNCWVVTFNVSVACPRPIYHWSLKSSGVTVVCHSFD